jgi:hypothetical protein
MAMFGNSFLLFLPTGVALCVFDFRLLLSTIMVQYLLLSPMVFPKSYRYNTAPRFMCFGFFLFVDKNLAFIFLVVVQGGRVYTKLLSLL